MKLPSKTEMKAAARKAARAAGLPDPYARPNRRKPLKIAKTDPDTGEVILVNRKGQYDKDPFFRRLEQSMTRDEFTSIMGVATDERAIRLFKMMMEPRYMKRSLAWMACECGLSYAELVVIIKNQHIGEGTIAMSKHAPRVMEDVAVDSMSTEVTCGNCKGYLINSVAMVPVTEVIADEKSGRQIIQQKIGPDGAAMWERCLVCDGAGTLRKVGDAKARDLMFETLGLTGRKGPLVVQQFNQSNGGAMEDAVGSAQQALDVPVLKESNE